MYALQQSCDFYSIFIIAFIYIIYILWYLCYISYIFKIGITASTVSIFFLNRDLKTSTDKKYEDPDKKCFVVHQNIYLKSNCMFLSHGKEPPIKSSILYIIWSFLYISSVMFVKLPQIFNWCLWKGWSYPKPHTRTSFTRPSPSDALSDLFIKNCKNILQ